VPYFASSFFPAGFILRFEIERSSNALDLSRHVVSVLKIIDVFIK
jgi:hypothetical protein